MMKKIFAVIFAFVMLVSCAKKEEARYVAKVGDTVIGEGEFKFYLADIKTQAQMEDPNLVTDEAWLNTEMEGRRAIDVAKDRALEVAAENIAYIKVAEYLGITLTDDEESLVEDYKEYFLAQFDGIDGFKSYYNIDSIDENFIYTFCRAGVFSEKLAMLALEEKPITDTERQDKFNELSSGMYKAKHILFAAIDETTMAKLSDDEIAAKKVTADEVYARVLAGEDFDTLMNEYSEDPGLAGSPDGYLFGPGEMIAEFESTVAGLEIGGIGFVESDYGYHIILRLPLTQEDLAAEIEYEIAYERLSEAMPEWKQQAGVKVEKNEAIFNEIM